MPSMTIERACGHSARWIAAPRGLGFHPRHIAVRAGVEKRAQTFRRERDRVRPRNTDGVKTLRARECLERRLQRGRI